MATIDTAAVAALTAGFDDLCCVFGHVFVWFDAFSVTASALCTVQYSSSILSIR
jgi:hypothetical protein